MKTIVDRNAQILRMRTWGVSKTEVARRFGLSRDRIRQIEQRAAADESLAKRRAALRAQIRAADDPERRWPVVELIVACGATRLALIQLSKHFARTGQNEISLRELMDMCLPPPRDSSDWLLPPLLRVCGIGKKCYWAVADGLTATDLGARCNAEWQSRLVKVNKYRGRSS